MSTLNKFGLVVTLSIFIFFLLSITRESYLEIYLDYGGKVYGEKKENWGLKTIKYEFKVINGEWNIRRVGYENLFGPFKKEFNDWYEFQMEPIDYLEEYGY
jgi:hypothetical protein